jgi:hypothetical protein
MSILRYFNKHHGWYDGKRTPFGGGGPSWNPVSWVEPAIQSVGDAFASIDPGPAIGDVGASIDQAVNELPGGWVLPAIITAAIVAPELAPFLAEEGAAAGIEAGAGQDAFWQAIANGQTSEQAINAGLTAQTAAAGGTAGAGIADAVTQTPGANAILGAPDVTVPSLAPSTGGSFGSIVAPLEGSGAIPGAGATTLGGGGLTGALPAGVVVGDGTLGTTIGATYMATDAGTLATDMFGNAIPASSTGIGGFAPTEGLSAADIAKNAKRLQSIAKLLGGSDTSRISGRAAPTAGQWATQAAQNFAQATPEQFGGYYQMNKNPFTFQNPLAGALKGSASGLDVSGTSGQALNTQNQTANLLRTLA